MTFYKSLHANRRSFILINLFLFLLVFAAAPDLSAATGGELDPSFVSQIIKENQAVGRSVIIQPDGKILYTGFFLSANLQPRNYVARFNPDGSVDSSFDSGGTFPVGASIVRMALQPDGKILLGGTFASVAGQTRVNVARLNADGSFDPTFNANLASSSGALSAIAVQSDGKILLTGSFASIGGQTRNGFARVNADGSLDTAFNSPCGGANAVAVQPDGKILVGNSCNSSSAGIARLNVNGTLDMTFAPGTGANGAAIETLALQPDGKVLVGGQFTTFNGVARRGIARLNANGALDTTFVFTADSNYETRSIVVQTDGKIITARSFGLAGANSVFRLNADGTNDASFNANEIQVSDIYSLAVAADGRVYEAGKMQITAGGFTPFLKPFIRLNANGSFDLNFDPYILYPSLVYGVRNVVVQPDGKILASGEFNVVNRQTRSALVRFNADGTLDSTFALDANSGIFNAENIPFVLQPDGKIVIGSETAIVRLNANGTLDASFNVAGGASSTIKFIGLQPNGKILVAGNFNTIGGQTRSAHFARLNADGSVDSFNPDFGNTGSYLSSLLVQPDGKFLTSGNFSQVNGAAHVSTVRFNADGSVDSTFVSPDFGFNVPIFGAVQPDGKIVAANFNTVLRLNADGSFDNAFSNRTFNGANGASGQILTIALQADGKILAGGTFASTSASSAVAFRNNLARLNPNGSLDESFGNYGGVTGGLVHKIALQTDGKILIGGTFKMVNGFSHSGLARLNPSVLQNNRVSDFDGDGKADASVFRNGTWYINPSSNPSSLAPNGFYGVQFGLASDRLAPADYDGDGKTDIAVWRESEGRFYILQSSNNSVRVENFGLSGDILEVGDWDGDGKADFSTYREGAQSYFFYRGSLNNPSGNITYLPWGASGDKPMRGDFDGDGKQDAAIFRPSNNTWYIRQSSSSQPRYEQWGTTTDKFVPNDYDGDGKTDLAVFRDGIWYIKQSSNNQAVYKYWGLNSDALVPADYDGDGRTDVAVYRDGIYYIQNSSSVSNTFKYFGAPDDIPITSAFVR